MWKILVADSFCRLVDYSCFRLLLRTCDLLLKTCCKTSLEQRRLLRNCDSLIADYSYEPIKTCDDILWTHFETIRTWFIPCNWRLRFGSVHLWYISYSADFCTCTVWIWVPLLSHLQFGPVITIPQRYGEMWICRKVIIWTCWEFCDLKHHLFAELLEALVVDMWKFLSRPTVILLSCGPVNNRVTWA